MRLAERKALLDAALSYTESSPQFKIIPIRPGDKLPLIKTGRDHAEHASSDPDTIEGWFRRWPDCQIGCPTGAASGVVVLDADRKHDGEGLLAVLESALGPLPRDRVVRTRSGGLHVYLAHPAGGIRVLTGAGPDSSLGKLLGGVPGIDVRGDGGIVVLPPSPGYTWIADDDEPFPAIPPVWLAGIQGAGLPPPRPRPARPANAAPDSIDDVIARLSTILDGDRNATLFKIGVRLRHDGRTDGEILDALERINVARVSPSLSDREVGKIARSAARGAS
jgi:hypothetical protein